MTWGTANEGRSERQQSLLRSAHHLHHHHRYSMLRAGNRRSCAHPRRPAIRLSMHYAQAASGIGDVRRGSCSPILTMPESFLSRILGVCRHWCRLLPSQRALRACITISRMCKRCTLSCTIQCRRLAQLSGQQLPVCWCAAVEAELTLRRPRPLCGVLHILVARTKRVCL